MTYGPDDKNVAITDCGTDYGLIRFLITFARSKTKGLLRAVLSVIAFVILLIGVLGGAASIM